MAAKRIVKNREIVDGIEERLRRGVRPEELAAKAGLSVSTLYWVRRAGVMSTATAEKLSSALGLCVAEGRP